MFILIMATLLTRGTDGRVTDWSLKNKNFDRAIVCLLQHALPGGKFAQSEIIPYSHNLRVFVAMKHIEGTEWSHLMNYSEIANKGANPTSVCAR